MGQASVAPHGTKPDDGDDPPIAPPKLKLRRRKLFRAIYKRLASGGHEKGHKYFARTLFVYPDIAIAEKDVYLNVEGFDGFPMNSNPCMDRDCTRSLFVFDDNSYPQFGMFLSPVLDNTGRIIYFQIGFANLRR